MAIIMVAMLAFGGTYAYFTDEVTGLLGSEDKAITATIQLDEDNVSFTTKTVTENVLPGETVFAGTGATLKIADKSNRTSYIFISFSMTLTSAEDSTVESLASSLSAAGATISSSVTDETLTLETITFKHTAEDDTVTNYVFNYIHTNDIDGVREAAIYTIDNINATLSWDLENKFQNSEITMDCDLYQIQGNIVKDEAHGSAAESAARLALKDVLPTGGTLVVVA